MVALEEVDLILEIVRPIILRRGGEESYVRVGTTPSTDILDEGVQGLIHLGGAATEAVTLIDDDQPVVYILQRLIVA